MRLRRKAEVTYTDETHKRTLAAITEDGDRIVGTCGTCGSDMWLLLGDGRKRVVCDCGERIPPSFFTYAEGRARP